jgi:hypothetical protein
MARFCFSVKWFIGKDFFCFFRLDPMTKLEMERITLMPPKSFPEYHSFSFHPYIGIPGDITMKKKRSG